MKGEIFPNPEIIEVSEEENLLGYSNLNGEIAESTGISAIQIDDNGCGTYGVFDNHYNPRQVHSLNNRIHANNLIAKQHDQYVACSSSKFRIGDVYNKILFLNISTVNCVNCKKDNTAQFIANTGASDTFTFDKLDFATFTKMDASVQTVDKKFALQILGYGTVFVKHIILINKKKVEVTTKI